MPRGSVATCTHRLPQHATELILRALDTLHSPDGTLPVVFIVSASLLPRLAVMICP
jgi:hypothetical protein